MDKGKLTQEELLDELARVSIKRINTYHNIGTVVTEGISKQAYTQLKEIIEWAYARGIPQQKKTVTKEELGMLVGEFQTWLRSIGVEVVE